MTADVEVARARVLVVGAGGLGCPLALVLARAGVRTIGIVDDDVVELSNLHRQILFSEEDLGSLKVHALKARLRAWAPSVDVETHAMRVLPSNVIELVRAYDLVVEGSDNFATKFLIADACALTARAVVHGAAVRWHGTALAVGASARPCYRCLFEDLPREHVPNCEQAGVVGPMVGIIAAVQADLALGILRGRTLGGTLVQFDAKFMRSRRLALRPRRSCELCGPTRSIFAVEQARYLEEGCM